MLNRSSILAHRGLHQERDLIKNSKEAIFAAIDSGFGVEVDIRMYKGELILSHDSPLKSEQFFYFNNFLKHAAGTDLPHRMALNIKEDGHALALKNALEKHNLTNYFTFDMSIPDNLSYIDHAVPFYTRVSEYEVPCPQLLYASTGLWIDAFTENFDQLYWADVASKLGLRYTLVSPELHGRNPKMLWTRINDLNLQHSELFEICTDYPLAFELHTENND